MDRITEDEKTRVGLFSHKDEYVWVDKSLGRVYFEKEVE